LTADAVSYFNLDTINDESKYGRWTAYSISKSANILFSNEFNRCSLPLLTAIITTVGADTVPVTVSVAFTLLALEAVAADIASGAFLRKASSPTPFTQVLSPFSPSLSFFLIL
jgi:hypothetical protein